MEEKRMIKIKGVMDASSEHGEAFVTEFVENDGFIDECEIDLIELFEELNQKSVTIEIVSEG